MQANRAMPTLWWELPCKERPKESHTLQGLEAHQKRRKHSPALRATW